MKRIKLGDWVYGNKNSYEFIGFVLAKDKSQCRVQFTQVYNTELKRRENVPKMKHTIITAQVSQLSLLEDYHINDVKDLINMALDNKSKRDFNKFTKYLEKITNNKNIPENLWETRGIKR